MSSGKLNVVEDHRDHGVGLVPVPVPVLYPDPLDHGEEDWSYKLHTMLCGLELPSSASSSLRIEPRVVLCALDVELEAGHLERLLP